jgi:sugar lactone lactonase YvrE
MRLSFFIALLSSIVLMLASCGKPAKPATEVDASLPTSVEVAVSKEISGPVLGRSISNPTGLAVDFRGTVYACDAGNDRLIKFGPDLTPLKDHGGYGSQPGQLSKPRFITVDNNLNILVSETGNQRVSRFDAELNYVDEITFFDQQDPLKFGSPSGIAVTDYGEMWIGDKDKNRVTLWTNVGQFDRFVGDFGYSGGELSDPEKIISYQGDKFIVCDVGNRRLVFYDDYGNYDREIREQGLESPVAVASDSQGHLWVLDQSSGRLSLYAAGGTRLYVGGPLLVGTSAPLSRPSDVIVLPGDRLLIADSGNNRIVECRIIFGKP